MDRQTLCRLLLTASRAVSAITYSDLGWQDCVSCDSAVALLGSVEHDEREIQTSVFIAPILRDEASVGLNRFELLGDSTLPSRQCLCLCFATVCHSLTPSEKICRPPRLWSGWVGLPRRVGALGTGGRMRCSLFIHK